MPQHDTETLCTSLPYPMQPLVIAVHTPNHVCTTLVFTLVQICISIRRVVCNPLMVNPVLFIVQLRKSIETQGCCPLEPRQGVF